MPKSREAASATLENLYRIFTIPEEPTFVSTYTEFVKEKLVAQSVHTAAPGFIGHMTSALPYFMLPLSRIMTALNQNTVKVETSKAFTPLERQVLAMLHRLIYRGDDAFYEQWIHDSRHALGAFCSGGTIANLTALWVARNRLFAPSGEFRGISQEGLARALKHLDCDGIAVLVSRRGHYSFGKAADVLGIGRDHLVMVDTDADNRIDMQQLRRQVQRLRDENIRPLAMVGIAGTTETGNVDPLNAMADLSQEIGCHFHVDAAWGGPTLFSSRHRHLLEGIERADSVTIDAHKQLYVPMGAGMVLFRDPNALAAIEHHAAYILRHGSKDLGSHTLEGSRPGKAMLVHAGLSIIGRKGYELLIDLGVERARTFAGMIRRHPDFELTSEPELNILTYRYCPSTLQQRLAEATQAQRERINSLLDQLNQLLQKHQREAGKTFVSRTRLQIPAYGRQELTVLRVVLANPLTTDDVLAAVLDEQCAIVQQGDMAALLEHVEKLSKEIAGEIAP